MKTLIYNCSALLMDDSDTLLKDAYVVVENTKIAYVGTERPEGDFDETIDGGGQVLMPGLVNAHTHVPMTLLRGYGDGNNLQDWLYNYIFPKEALLDDRAVAAGTALGLAEMIASGTTTIADMYDHCDAICQQVVQAGMNMNISRGTTLFTPDFDPQTHEGWLDAVALAEKWHGYNNGQILVDVSIHGEYTSSPALWAPMANLAKEKGLRVHVHLSETASEHEECVARWGKTPFQILDHYGVWDNGGIAAHCVYTTPEDWALMAQKGVSVIHNPTSNLKLGSGVAPIPAMLKAGVNVALGTDGVSSNNNHDLFEEMKLAGILHNGVGCNPTAILPKEALTMATVNGGKALGRNIGKIAVGYQADLILVNFSHLNLTPCHSVVSHLVYAACGGNVSMNMAGGKVIYRDGVFFTLDIQAIKDEINNYALPLLFGGD